MNKKSFTLIELIVSASLLLIIITGFSFLIKTGISSAKKASRLALTINKTQAKMEELRAISFSELKNLRDPEARIRLISSDLLEIEVGGAYTLRSKY